MGVLRVGPEPYPGLLRRVTQHDLNSFFIAFVQKPTDDDSVGNGPYGRASLLRNIDAFVQRFSAALVGVVNGPLFAVDLGTICAVDKFGIEVRFDDTPGFLYRDIFQFQAIRGKEPAPRRGPVSSLKSGIRTTLAKLTEGDLNLGDHRPPNLLQLIAIHSVNGLDSTER